MQFLFPVIVLFNFIPAIAHCLFVIPFLFHCFILRLPPALPLSHSSSSLFHTLLNVFLFALLHVYRSPLSFSPLPASSLGEVGSLATDGGLLFISIATLEEKRVLVGESNSSLAEESVLVIMLRPLLSSSTSATVSLKVLLGDMALDGAIAWSS